MGNNSLNFYFPSKNIDNYGYNYKSAVQTTTLMLSTTIVLNT